MRAPSPTKDYPQLYAAYMAMLELDALHRRSQLAEHTDVEDVWEVVDAARSRLRDALDPFVAGMPVVGKERGKYRESPHGKLTGAHRRCQMDGCGGQRLTTRWEDGKITHPCTKGMAFDKLNGWRIL